MSYQLILKAVAGDLRGQEFVFASPVRCVLGRSRSCSLRLPYDPTVSRQHCLLESDDDGLWAQDLCSLNGTFVNGTKIGTGSAHNADATQPEAARHLLRDGDELRVCGNVFQVRLEPEESGTLVHADARGEFAMAM
ncbi:MAG: FHA domain-containing protein [Gemmataceae bacterium]